MKKIVALLLALFVAGCSSNDYISCDISVDNSMQNYKMEGTYKIYYDKNVVTKIEKEETYTSLDESVISYFEEAKNLEYYNLNDIYGGFNYIINKKNESLNLNIIIDMNKVDISRLVKDDRLNKDYVISDKLTVSGAKKIYKAIGAVCDI